MIYSPWRPGIALATQVLEFCKVLDIFYSILEFYRALENPYTQTWDFRGPR